MARQIPHAQSKWPYNPIGRHICPVDCLVLVGESKSDPRRVLLTPGPLLSYSPAKSPTMENAHQLGLHWGLVKSLLDMLGSEGLVPGPQNR